MSIDGRDLGRPHEQPEKDPFESRGIGIVSTLLVAIPAIMLLALVFWIGTWMGGWLLGGVGTLVSTAALVGFMWMRRRHRG